MSATPQKDVIAFLSDPKSYDATVQAVDIYETHGSIVFLAGQRAYKLKRAVKFPYLDYSTVALRRRMCRRELEVNRRTAPTLYLGVWPVIDDGAGALRFGTDTYTDAALDWVVVMRRFDQDTLLENMRVAGTLTPSLMRLVAETIAAFHRRAEIMPDMGGAGGIREVIDENIAIFQSRAGRPFDDKLVRQYETEALRVLAGGALQLDDRQRQGFVRRCHGDLHLNNICMIDGEPVLFDAIEFSDAFACIDVLYDLAFLLMDLDRHANRDFANVVLNRYVEETGAYSGLAVLPLFLSCRAAVRAHTTLAAGDVANDESVQTAQHQNAVQLLERAVGYLAKPPPRLIAVGGVSGTGKTSLARGLAPVLGASPGAIVIRSDIIRKQLAGVAETVRLPESAYAPAMTAKVYARIGELAGITLAAGYSVIADAVFGKDSERRDLAELAKRAGVPFTGLWLEAPPELLEGRINARSGDASDATPDVLRAQLRYVSPPEEWVRLSAGTPPGQVLDEARRALGC